MNEEKIKQFLNDYNDFKDKCFEVGKTYSYIYYNFLEKITSIDSDDWDLKDELEFFKILDDYIKPRIIDSLKIKNYSKDPNVEDKRILFSWSEPCGRGCCYSDYNVSFPIRYLWEDNWEVELKKELDNKIEEKKDKIRRENREYDFSFEG